MALQSRKGKADDLTITISKSTSVSVSICYKTCVSVIAGHVGSLSLTETLFCYQDSRVVVTKPIGVSSPAAETQQEAGSDRAKESPVQQGSSRGHRKQLTVTMAGKKVLHFCSLHILH